MNEREGYTSISLKGLLAQVDEHSKETGIENRSEVIRMILKRYFDLKEQGIDILKVNDKEIEKAMFPNTFGLPDKTPAQLEKGKEPPKDQSKLPVEDDDDTEQDTDEDAPVPEKKKRGRPKKA